MVFGGSVSRAFSSPTLLAQVMATKEDTFAERCRNEQDAKGLNGGPTRADKTKFKSQGVTGSQIDRNSPSRPLKNLLMIRLVKTFLPSIQV